MADSSSWKCPDCPWEIQVRHREDQHAVWVHQKILCPAVLVAVNAESCGHLARDIEGRCMECAREAERRKDMAQAWDECHAEAYHRGTFCSAHRNPYREADRD